MDAVNRTANTLRNIKTAIIGQALAILINIISRKIFLIFLSVEYLGLNGLFSNILSMLALAELGVGTAIIYSLYRPIAENNVEEIKSLMKLYKYIYCSVGAFILIAGCALTPFLHLFVREMPNIPYIRLIYIIFVLNSAVSYFYTYKRSLIIANQMQYIITIYHYSFMIFMNFSQIIVLYFTHNFILYLLLQTTNTLLENVLISRKADSMYPYIRGKNIFPLRNEVKSEIKRNVFAMVFHRIGGVIVFATDNILISKIIDLNTVGLYSNYMLIRQAVNAVTGQLFQSVSASFGNLNAQASDERKLEIFYVMNFAGAWIFGFCSICIFNLVNPFISLWLGEEYLFSMNVVFWIVLAFYVTGMRQACLTARDAMGLFWYDRYKPVFEIGINIVMSIILGVRYGISGIMAGTVISTMLTCFWIEPYILYKYGFHSPMAQFFIRYFHYSQVTLFAGYATALLCSRISSNGLIGFLIKWIACMILPNIIFLLCYRKTNELNFILHIKYVSYTLQKLITSYKKRNYSNLD